MTACSRKCSDNCWHETNCPPTQRTCQRRDLKFLLQLDERHLERAVRASWAPWASPYRTTRSAVHADRQLTPQSSANSRLPSADITIARSSGSSAKRLPCARRVSRCHPCPAVLFGQSQSKHGRTEVNNAATSRLTPRWTRLRLAGRLRLCDHACHALRSTDFT